MGIENLIFFKRYHTWGKNHTIVSHQLSKLSEWKTWRLIMLHKPTWWRELQKVTIIICNYGKGSCWLKFVGINVKRGKIRKMVVTILLQYKACRKKLQSKREAHQIMLKMLSDHDKEKEKLQNKLRSLVIISLEKCLLLVMFWR